MVVGQGLTAAQAQEQLKQDGYNELPSSRHRSILAIAVDVIREPMFLLLLIGGVIYLLLGDIHEALILLAFVIVIMTITFVQERNTARALETLRDLSSPRARVLRDGQTKRIPGREVVRGDFILLSEGDRVPADAILLDCTNMQVDESLLTGESVPVRKAVCDGQQGMEPPGGHDRPYVYSGTLVVVGQGIAQVVATGAYTELGRIGHALQSVQEERTPLQRKAGILIKTLALIGGGLSVLVTVIYGVTRGDWLQGILVGITLAMAILPDEFAVILIIFLAVGAWRMSHQRVLTRRIPAVETLGAATVLCVDKTGTITQNSMSVKMLYSQGFWLDIDAPQQHSLPEEVHEVIEYSILASQRDPFDPTERAFLDLGKHTLQQTEHLHEDWKLVREYPLSRQLLSMSHVWLAPGHPHDFIVAAKGAPEAIAGLCHLDDKALTIVFQAIRLMADQGLRVLGVAYAIIPKGSLPENQHDFPFQFVGLVGLADPIRVHVPESVQECYRAGIRVIMITGDYAATAQSVARQIGLIPVDQVITGDDLRRMRQDELQQRIQTVSIFARVVPEQKLQIVNALKANGEIAAMTGDGVNDAPALRAAHIGIAMGGRGTDVAREAASLVLLDDDFTSIVTAIRMGRRIHENLRKAMAYILAIHIPIAGMTLIPVIFLWPLVLFPVHIAFLHLIIDPASSVAYEAEPAEPTVMDHPPIDPQAPLFDWQALIYSFAQGCTVLLCILAVFLIALSRGEDETGARSLLFATLIIANVGLIHINRSWYQSAISRVRVANPAVWWVNVGALLMLILVFYIPALRTVFRFAPLHPIDWLICFLAGIGSILWFEGLKWLSRQRIRWRKSQIKLAYQ